MQPTNEQPPSSTPAPVPSALSTPRIHRKPPATSCATPASSSGSRGIQLGGVIDDGWLYQPPLNLPQSTEDAMGLASEGKLTDVDMVETFRMMSRGQTFTSYVTTINKLDDSARVDRKEIYMFYNKRQHTQYNTHYTSPDGCSCPATCRYGMCYFLLSIKSRICLCCVCVR